MTTEWTIQDGTLVPGTRTCDRCRQNPGRRTLFPHTLPCPQCRGTGKRGRGRCRTCCTGYQPTPGRRTDHDRPTDGGPCPTCGGTARVVPDRYDFVPSAILATLPVRVETDTRAMGWAEQYLGVGLYSCVDYGTAWEQFQASPVSTTERLTASVRVHSVQACKITDERLRLCDGLLVSLTRQGYSVLPSWSK